MKGGAAWKRSQSPSSNVLRVIVGTCVLLLLVTVSPTRNKKGKQTSTVKPHQRCDYSLDEGYYDRFYEEDCWRDYSVEDWRQNDVRASRALFDHGALYMKEILTYKEALTLREYLVQELSPRTAGNKYYAKDLRDPEGRYDFPLDPREQGPVLKALNKIVTRVRPIFERILGEKAKLVELSVLQTCNATVQNTHADACSICCGLTKDRARGKLERNFESGSGDKWTILNATHYEDMRVPKIYSLFVALQPTREENGITFIYPDSHRLFQSRDDDDYDDDNDDDDDDDDDTDPFVDVLQKQYKRCTPSLNLGDGFIYNAATRHGAGKNPRTSARMMLIISFQTAEREGGFRENGLLLGPTYSVNPDFITKSANIKEKDLEGELHDISCIGSGKKGSSTLDYGGMSGIIGLEAFPLTAKDLSKIIEPRRTAHH